MDADIPEAPPAQLFAYAISYQRAPKLPDDLRRALIAAEEAKTETCTDLAAAHYNVHPTIMRGVRDQEKGHSGYVSRPNKNGTRDLGVYQINTDWIELWKPHGIHVTWQQLAYNNCLNAYLATWILRYEINRAGGDVSKGVGNYHSKTPANHSRYLSKIIKHIKKRVNKPTA